MAAAALGPAGTAETPGAQRTEPGPVPGAAPGVGAVPGGVPGSVPGSVPGAVPGSVPGGVRAPEEELPVLEASEIRNRLERSVRQFRNRRKVLIRGLPADISNQEIHELLSAYELKYCFVDKYKGTAFITFLNGEQAEAAIQEFHGQKLREKALRVQLQPTDSLLCVANLPQLFTQHQFEELVRPYGNLERCFLVYNSQTGHSKGYGFVEYMKKDSAARAKSDLLGKQLGTRTLYVHWTDVTQLTLELLHSKCLCVDKLPHNFSNLEELRKLFSQSCKPTFCQLAQGQDGQLKGFAVLEFGSAAEAELVQQNTDGAALAGNHIRVSFCAPGPPGPSILAALIAAQATALNRGKGLLPEPNLLQILSSLGNPTSLQLLLNPLLHGALGGKQGILGAAPSLPLVPNPLLSTALLQLALQNQTQNQQKLGLLGDSPLGSLPPPALSLAPPSSQPPPQLLGDLSSGSRPPLEPLPSSFASALPTPKPKENGAPSPGISLLGEPPKDFKIPLNPYLNLQSLLPPPSLAAPTPQGFKVKSGGLGGICPPRTSQPDPPRPPHGEGFGFEYQQDFTSRLFPPPRDPPALLGGGFLQRPKLSPPPSLERGGPLPPPFYSGSPTSYFTSGLQAGLNQSHPPKALGLPPDPFLSSTPPKTPGGAQKRHFSHLLPSPEPSPEGCYVGQHSQGLGGHYADSYLKRKRIF